MDNILLIGGDARTLILLKKLKENGFNVSTLGLTDNDNGDVKKADVIVFPVPTTKDKINVFCAFTDRKIPLDIIKNAKKDVKILCGAYRFEDFDSTDICTLDDYAILNAVPTAEGAIKYAIENTPFTLWKSKVLVIGYGRVGKILCDRLSGLKADVTVSARKNSDFAMLDALSVPHINTAEVKEKAHKFDIIFNTVDAVLFDDLKNLKNTLLIDLSSKGVIDFKKAEENKIKAVKLPAIPGKTAPDTAGEILFKTVINLISD